jgi:N-carbamoylputrescine amidase
MLETTGNRQVGTVTDTSVRIACIQMEPKIGFKNDNLENLASLLAQAAANGAQIVVAPELCNSGYMFESHEQAFALAEPVPEGPTCVAWETLAAEHNVHLVAGICERDGETLYNSCVLIGPGGFIGVYRKVHLWDQENRYFAPGDLGFPVFDTPHGRIGMFICYDSWFPEAYRTCASAEADLICLPTNWVPIPGQDESREPMANILVMASAHANSVFVAAADRVGIERGQPFIGHSLIVSNAGWPIGGPASANAEEIIYADAKLSEAKSSRIWNEFNVVLRDRRTTEYHSGEPQAES